MVEITLTPLELIQRIAAQVPPPRTHRHRYFGVLTPSSPLRAAVVALAQGAAVQPVQHQSDLVQVWQHFVEDAQITLVSDRDYKLHDALALLRRDCNVSD